jgi:hypothetical protein
VSGVTIIQEITDAIKRNRNPGIKRVVVSGGEYQQISDEMDSLFRIKPSSRPTYGGRFGNIDRQLWDELQALKNQRSISIMGVSVEVRKPARIAS